MPQPEVEAAPTGWNRKYRKGHLLHFIYLNRIKLEDGKKLETYEGLLKTYN